MEQGLKQGRQVGLQAGESKMLLLLLEDRFGDLDASIRDRVKSADAARLLEWGERAGGTVGTGGIGFEASTTIILTSFGERPSCLPA